MTGILRNKLYIYIFIGLALLTGLTVFFAFVDLGWMNLMTAVIISVLKALLIAYFFMHLNRMEMVVRIFTIGSLLWLFILLFYTFSDYASRGWISNPSFWKQ